MGGAIGHSFGMRLMLWSALLLMSFAPQPAVAESGSGSEVGLAALEHAWHDCVREAFAHQPRTQSRAASQRSALDECQAQEDAFVAAAMTAETTRPQERIGRHLALADRARAWAASVASDVIDPVSSWFGAWRR